MPQPPTLKVIEVFASVQGEGLRLGQPTIFIRLAGCNLRCAFCDTKYAWRGGQETTPARLVQEAVKVRRRFPCRWVCLTGGEPLLQKVKGLVLGLKARGFEVQVETNGTFRPGVPADWFSVSPKPPRYDVALEFRRKADEVKLVVSRGLSFQDVQRVRQAFPGRTPLLLQPQSNLAWSVRKGWKLLGLSLDAGLVNIRLTVQAHKILGLP
jgi:organic radical activating enzyme